MTFNLTTLPNLLRIMLVCWVTMQLQSYPLWHGLRDFPLVPVLDFFSFLPWYLSDVFFYAGLAFMLLLIWKPNKKMASILLLLVLMSALFDQNRWQPWHYQFIWMLAAFVFLKQEKQVIFSWQIILIAVYFYSGFSKLQSHFIHDVWKYQILEQWLGIASKNNWIWRLGYLLPITEMLFALMLLFVRFRKVGVVALVSMHVFILLWLGPFGLNFNAIIWAWNVVLPLLLFGLFYQQPMQLNLPSIKHPFVMAMMLFCCVLPFFCRWGFWDRNLSFAIYASAAPQLYICTRSNEVLIPYAPYMSNRSTRIFSCPFPIPVNKWAMMSMGVPYNPEKRVLLAIAKAWKIKHPNAAAEFYFYTGGFAPKVQNITDLVQ